MTEETTLITKTEAATACGVTTRTICRWRERGWIVSQGHDPDTGAALFRESDVLSLAAWHAARSAPVAAGETQQDG